MIWKTIGSEQILLADLMGAGRALLLLLSAQFPCQAQHEESELIRDFRIVGLLHIRSVQFERLLMAEQRDFLAWP
jgi:hypothetical protein